MMASMRGLFASVCLLDVVALGCGGGGGPARTPTYWGDVAPLLNAKCVGCHQAGGIGPFVFDGYDAAMENGAVAAAMVDEGLMPPFLVDHSGSCGDFEDADTPTAAEKATLRAWVDGGMPEGEPRTLTLAPVPHLGEGTDYRTPDFAPAPQGGTLAEHDEYRCFMLDSGLAADAFVTGYEVTPGNAAIVHHVLVFTVDPAVVVGGKTNGDVMSALDAASPDRAGWPCFGGAGAGVEPDAIPVTWAPGQGMVNYPDGVGAGVTAAEKVVVQIHYNLADPATLGQRDQTTVRMRFAATVARRAVFALPDKFPDTVGAATPAMLPPGQASTTFTFDVTAQELGLDRLAYADVLAVMPHMHERGHRLELRHAATATATPACIARVAAWDFHWQKMYGYRTPIRLGRTSKLTVSCDYDTRGVTDPILPGWGTQNEMCLTVLMVALPPGI